eukprot:11196846-Lingulodinium_polyedra.AAC.1
MPPVARQQRVRSGHPWSDQLGVSARNVLRGAVRGLGPPKQLASRSTGWRIFRRLGLSGRRRPRGPAAGARGR